MRPLIVSLAALMSIGHVQADTLPYYRFSPDQSASSGGATALTVSAEPVPMVAQAPVRLLVTGGGGIAPIQVSAVGPLPGGLNFDGTYLSGTPETAGTYAVPFKATDSTGASSTVTVRFTVAGDAMGRSLSVLIPPDGEVGTPYSGRVALVGVTGNTVFTLLSGQMGLGLSFDQATGTVSGSPTGIGSLSDLVVQAVNDGKTFRSQPFTITVSPLMVASPPTPSALVMAAGALTTLPFSVQGGRGPYAWTFADYPAGMAPQGASLVGTPPTPTNGTLAATVTDAAGRARSVGIAYQVVGDLVATAAATITRRVGTYASKDIGSQSNAVGTMNWSLGAGSPALPTGLSLLADGKLQGSPTTSGTFGPYEIRASDSRATVAAGSTRITVQPQLKVTPPAQTSYSFPINSPIATLKPSYTDNVGAVTWGIESASGAAPGFLTVDKATGIIGGSSATAGSYTAYLRATDADGTSSLVATPVSITLTAADASTTKPNQVLYVYRQNYMSWSTGSGVTQYPSSDPQNVSFLYDADNLTTGNFLYGDTGRTLSLTLVFAQKVTADCAMVRATTYYNGGPGTAQIVSYSGTTAIGVGQATFTNAGVTTAQVNLATGSVDSLKLNYSMSDGNVLYVYSLKAGLKQPDGSCRTP